MESHENKIKENAIAFAKKNKKVIAKEFTNPSIYMAEKKPVSVFMAGSPGAGKTEASKHLLAKKAVGENILRIDADDLRDKFDEYDGSNSHLFQGAVSILVDRILDLALSQNQSFILDGTLSKYDKAKYNIKRSLKKGRKVQILYVYQHPELAWKFVRKREKLEGRRIKPETFIDQYFSARDVVNKLKKTFGKDIKVDLILKDFDNSNRLYKAGVDQIDNHIPEKYTRLDIEELISKY